MGILGKKAPMIAAERKITPHGNIKSGIVFTVRGGLGKLCDIRAVSDDADYAYNDMTMLNGTPIVQFRSPWCPTCKNLLMAGYGIENADCPELDEVCKAVNADFIDIEHSFEIMRPLLGLLKDGHYLLADAECIPTDGEGNFFWDIGLKMKSYEAAVSMYYISEEGGCDLFAYESVEPLFLYPTQSAALYNSERAEYYRRHNKNNDNAPRAIAFNDQYGVSALLDGHHKAAAAALDGERVKCLLIIPSFEQFFKPKDKEWKFVRQVFTEDIFFKAEEFTEKEKAVFMTEWLAKRNAPQETSGYTHTEPRFRLREWEDEFGAAAKRYPTVRRLTLMKIFGGEDMYEKRAAKLNAALESGNSVEYIIKNNLFGLESKYDDIYARRLVLRLMLTKAADDADPVMKKAACAIVREVQDYDLVCSALRYLLMLGEDSDTEQLCTDIISDPEKYDRFGHIAVDYWEDE